MQWPVQACRQYATHQRATMNSTTWTTNAPPALMWMWLAGPQPSVPSPVRDVLYRGEVHVGQDQQYQAEGQGGGHHSGREAEPSGTEPERQRGHPGSEVHQQAAAQHLSGQSPNHDPPGSSVVPKSCSVSGITHVKLGLVT
jgi:hypothetical protein